MSKIIFLDIDGVLNSQQIADEIHLRTGGNGYGGFFKETDPVDKDVVRWGQDLVDNLKEVVEWTHAKIVISSTWRKHFSVAKFKDMLALYGWPDAPVVDSTPDGYRIRGAEVKSWLDTHPEVTDYVILDDYDEFLVTQRPFFVQTDPEVGLTKSDAATAINILNQIPY